MAGFIKNIKSNIMLAQANYLVKTENFSKYLSNVKSGKFDIKNEKIRKQFKDFIDNYYLTKTNVWLDPFQDRLFLASIYPEYMNFETDPLLLCHLNYSDLQNDQQLYLIKKFVKDNNLYSKVGENLEGYFIYYSGDDINLKESIILFMKFLKENGYKPLINYSFLDCSKITKKLQQEIIDNDLMTSELADRLWTYSTFGNEKFKILDSIKDMSRSYKFWNDYPYNQYFDWFKDNYNENAFKPFGMPSENLLKSLVYDYLNYLRNPVYIPLSNQKEEILELLIKNKNNIVIRTFFEEKNWDTVISIDYHNMNDIFSKVDIYALDKYKNINDNDIKSQFVNLYIIKENINNIDDVNNIYNEIVRLFFKETKWTNIISLDYHHMNDIFSDADIYALDKYKILNNFDTKDRFKKYYVENDITINKIDFLCDLINRLNLSNSVELVKFQGAIFNELLKTDEPLKKFESIEKIFVKNNIPIFAKIFKCFQILYPDLSNSFKFENQKISPELAKLNFRDTNLEKLSKNIQPNDMRLQVIFNDLFRISLGSNNHSLKEYIKNIENGNILYISLLSDNITYDELSTLQKQTLDIFINHLETLLDNSKYKLNENYNNLSSFDKIKMLGQCFKITSRYDLPDRIVRHFLFFAGINSFEELKNKINNVVISKDKINEERGKYLEKSRFTLETGDFIRGVGSESNLINSLNMGNVCKEYLGSIKGISSSDSTPLDIDFSKITFKEDNKTSIKNTPSGLGGYGDYYIVIKHNNPNMIVSRDSTGDKDVSYDPDKFEMFRTLADNHYGVRTGISSTDIDYIMINGDNDISRLKFEIAKNGFYIPVVNIEGNLLYTVSEYNSLKEKMSGLSYYDTENYKLSTEHLYFPGIDKIIANMREDRERQIAKRSILQSTIKNILSSSNLGIDKINMKPTPDLSDNNVDLIEIGSTSRGTNVPNDSDYDFILKVGKQQAIQNSNAILSKFSECFNPKENNSHTNRFRGTNIDIEGFDAPVDIDISIDQKKNSEIYFSDTSLQDRLNNIKKQYPKDYEAVLANIVYAKELLKKEGCYKPYKSDSSQSGLGGIGVENWVLQNGGSLYSAAKSFYDASADKTFNKFKEVYKVWDFGQNHEPREKNGTIYPFDEYVSDNMAENGYLKMRDACKRYLEFVKNETFEITQDEQLENDVSMKR